jgi:hypothetical protein
MLTEHLLRRFRRYARAVSGATEVAATRLTLECIQKSALHRPSLTRKVRIRAKSPDWMIEQTRFS